MLWFGFYNTVYHCENGEITPELRDDLIKFSFDDLEGVMTNSHIRNPDRTYSTLAFAPLFLAGVKKLVCQSFQSSISLVLMYST
jgi:hypothetical protein